MARPLRIEYENAWYHVMNRGAAQQAIFLEDRHRELFLDLLHEIYNRYQIEIHSYCLMDNHYHLLMRTPLGNLSRAMRHLNGIYTQRFNKAMKSDGPLFRGRYKSIIVDAENYLLQLSRYIHLNPVAGKLVKKPEEYLWSSYVAYLDHKRRPRWLRCDEILNRFGSKMQKAKYRAFIEEGIDKEINLFFEKMRKIPILGTEAFTKTISEKYLTNRLLNNEIPEEKHLYRKKLPNFLDVIKTVSEFYQISAQSIQTAKYTDSWPRNITIYLAVEVAQIKLSRIAEEFTQLTHSAISKICYSVREAINRNAKLRNDIKLMQTQLLQNKDSVFKT